ncbi:hypothetical protein COU17_01540 [Candidatus Kaiserbacteria bacterium CG10_big_fil_rev_8_21_14_0_10_49_17]|uniref:Protease PrsW n=1 Tax=Candidatus Kaiserbacteria bacterium CG10_big_fil_rev_8_21_14_0_10_49_17 TaxID=1974609 RepID=A0A2M6WER6_9BACT|nr:MAG: hypothetical protein COU17_01540 [Candidatus Kaiserbacteria bacterium CG10_big_fil_rev_8_21_14_0_10_49_17]
MISTQTLLYALLGGVLPALLWLWFWLKEDKRCPEPRGLILFAFLIGGLLVPLVIPAQKWVMGTFSGVLVIILWAVLEEVFKYVGAWLSVLKRKAMNEPVDAVIYMVTVALGFSALENALFLLNPLSVGQFIDGFLTGNLRFFGATLLHVLSSATIGVALALSFYKSKKTKRLFLLCGLILAIILHTVFNFLIINSNGENIFLVFLGVWCGVIVLILLFEKIKRIKKPSFSNLKNRK